MKVLLVHPSPLMYTEIFLRLEPLGLELVAQAARAAGHSVRLVDLQVFGHRDFFQQLREFAPDAVGFSVNYLANVPEVIDLAKAVKRRLPRCFVFAGGHSVSFIAGEVLEHACGAIDCILRGEGEAALPLLLAAARDGAAHRIPGAVTLAGTGPAPIFVESLDRLQPARDLLRRRRKYFIGELDPCASIEFTRGCPWDCSFCSAWTFYGRSYRKVSPERAAEDLASIAEPNVFIVDDVAFVHPEDGEAIARAIERRKLKKRYYLETRCDVLLKAPEIFERWKRLGLKYMFLGLEALDEEGLAAHRKRITPGENFKALEIARKIGITVAVNIIADCSWDERRFAIVREWAESVPEIVNITVATPYPGTEIWFTESRNLTTHDYRLFDVQHAVLPTKLPLEKFYEELVRTQSVLNRKHLGWAALRDTARLALDLALEGQTNFLAMLWKFRKVYSAERQLSDHRRAVNYLMRPPAKTAAKPSADMLFIHPARTLKRGASAAQREPVASGA
jgi:hopanoid C-3 methylase HpnR